MKQPREKAVLLWAERERSLSSLETIITPELYATLAKKISFERETCAELLASEAGTQEKKQRLNAVLPSDHFIRRRLSADII